MKNIFIIHGSYGSPQENWFPWLKKELSKLGHRVYVPQFPIPKTRNSGKHELKKWLETFDDYKSYLDENSIIIAHSRGNVFAWHLLEIINKPINATFLIAPFLTFTHWHPDNSDSFYKPKFDWRKIKKMSKYFEVFQSANDDIPVSEGEEIANNLNAKLIIVKNAGHFNVAYDKKFIQFPLLLNNIKDFIEKNS